ncbi:putative lipoprotein [Helicobacter pylori Hp P-15]|uniref:Putative lipoprotein n=1 Tax=Helicobacter pylori Hp P-15 TaxID=992080 RepID=J0QC87_HELPX|nr:hypothetical protein [Helicobacter pylori]EJC08411.1 putative lipoprotein [Helicobacter pylori Hp P-15]
MRISLLAVILALLFVACHETKNKSYKTKPIAPLQKKPSGNLNKNKNCKNPQRHFLK